MDPLAPLPEWAEPSAGAAGRIGERISEAVALARDLGTRLPLPGDGTLARWAMLAAVARVNLTAARVLEPHADALAILVEAGAPVADDRTWGVYAAEAPDVRLDWQDGVLRGTKPWCSLAADLDAALVTAHTPSGRQLFRVDLRHPGVTVAPADEWVARGLRTVVSTSVSFDDVPAEPVGEPGWYLRRAGFAAGGIGVAACWFGGAQGVLQRLHKGAATRNDDVTLAELGGADVALHAAAAALRDAAAQVDAGAGTALLAARVRAVVAAAGEDVLSRSARALGPAPLTAEADHAARVADLQLYLRQHHGGRDLAALGRLLTSAP